MGDSNCLKNSSWAKTCSLSLRILNECELHMLHLFEYELVMYETEYLQTKNLLLTFLNKNLE
jgi:hypothetical protein